jgi:hypothetical protein
MTDSHSDNRIEEIRTLITKIIGQSLRPLSRTDILTALPMSYRVDPAIIGRLADDLVRLGVVFPWPPRTRTRAPRYWNQDESFFLAQIVRARLSRKVYTHTQLFQEISEKLFGYPRASAEKRLRQALAHLIREGVVFAHPPLGRNRCIRYSLFPPEIPPSLQKGLRELHRVVPALQKAGVPAEAILETIATHLGISVRKSASIPSSDTRASVNQTAEDLLVRMNEVVPGAIHQVPVWIPALRKAVRLSREEFDRALLHLAHTGKIFLDKHAHPGQMTPEEKEEMLTDDGGNWFVAALIRKDADHG